MEVYCIKMKGKIKHTWDNKALLDNGIIEHFLPSMLGGFVQ